MSESPSTFCPGSASRWNTFCSSAQIVESDDSDDLLLQPVTLPELLPQLIEAASTNFSEHYRYLPSISQVEFDRICEDEDFVQVVPGDAMDFGGHMEHLCRLYNRFKGALRRSTSETAIRRAVDDLFELVFETDRKALINSSYCVESKVHVVKYDQRQLPQGPTAVATADGAVIIPIPMQLLRTLRAGGRVYAGPDLLEQYALSFVEYKGGLSNNGRQAILDSAAMQAVNRAFGLDGVKNYTFSVHHAKVDVITSWWDQAAKAYRFMRRNDKFILDTPIGWFRFYSFLCCVRTSHHTIRDVLRDASPSTVLSAGELFHPRKLPSIQEHVGGNSEGSRSGITSGDTTEGQTEMQDAEDEIALGDDASTYREISVEAFCRDDDSEEEDDGDASDHDAAGDVKTKVQSWQENVPPVVVDLRLAQHTLAF